jgi:hypothetical protein
MKVPVKACTTAAITLSGEQTVDGVALVTGDRCLVNNQASSVDNGIYKVDTGAWSRTLDCDGSYDLVQGSMVHVYGGTTNGNKVWRCTTANSSATNPYVAIGTASISFAAMDIQLTGSSSTTWCGTATGTANALVLTPTTAATTLRAGDSYVFKAGVAANSGAATAAISGLPATAIQQSGAALVGGEIVANGWHQLTVDGAGNFQLRRILPGVGRDTTDTLTNKTLTSPTINAATLSGTLAGTPTFSGVANFSATGTHTFSGPIDISGASAGQISFPATQNPSAGANVLDDYEEGTWTPNIGGSATYTNQIARYIKVGKLVTLISRFTVNVLGTGSTTTVSGAPFASASLSTDQSGYVGTWATLAVNVINIACFIQNNASTIQFSSSSAAGATSSNGIGLFGNSADVMFSIPYQAAA